MTAVAVIPARLGSTRLPRKVLADIHGKPLIQHVWERTCAASSLKAVYVATDAEEVADVVRTFGGQPLMTSEDARSGTERIAQCLPHLDADLIVNVQGDEPLVDAGMIDALVAAWHATPSDLITPVFRITALDEIENPNIVKVARTRDAFALYFSRSPIPFVRDVPMARWLDDGRTFWGHIGVYGYRRDVLAAYPGLTVSALETAESLEQLRFLDAGYRFLTVETTYRPIAVDVAADLEQVRALIGAGR